MDESYDQEDEEIGNGRRRVAARDVDLHGPRARSHRARAVAAERRRTLRRGRMACGVWLGLRWLELREHVELDTGDVARVVVVVFSVAFVEQSLVVEQPLVEQPFVVHVEPLVVDLDPHPALSFVVTRGGGRPSRRCSRCWRPRGRSSRSRWRRRRSWRCRRPTSR